MTEQLTNLDFFDAAKIAFPKGWRVRFNNGHWRKFVNHISGEGRLTKENGTWWFPQPAQMQEKKWDVEKPEEEKVVLPWERWHSDDLPEEEFCFFAIMESGLLTKGIWREWGSCYRAVVVHPVEDKIKWYFRVDESMLPEDLE